MKTDPATGRAEKGTVTMYHCNGGRLRRHPASGYGLAALLALSLCLLSPARADDPEETPPATDPPANTGGTGIDDMSYAAGVIPPTGATLNSRTFSSTDKIDRYLVLLQPRVQYAGISALVGQVKPIVSVYYAESRLQGAIDFGFQFTGVETGGGVGGFSGFVAHSPPLARIGKLAQSLQQNTAALKEEQRKIATANKYDPYRDKDKIRTQEARFTKQFTEVVGKAPDQLQKAYESYIRGLRYKITGEARYFPDSFVYTAVGINAAQYLDNSRHIQATASANLAVLDPETQANTVLGGRFAVGAAWQNEPAIFKPAKYTIRKKAEGGTGGYGSEKADETEDETEEVNVKVLFPWSFQVGFEYVPDNGIDGGDSWSTYFRYRVNSKRTQDYEPGFYPEVMLRTGQFVNDRDFVQVRLQFPLAY